MCQPVSDLVYIKEPLLLIKMNSPMWFLPQFIGVCPMPFLFYFLCVLFLFVYLFSLFVFGFIVCLCFRC